MYGDDNDEKNSLRLTYGTVSRELKNVDNTLTSVTSLIL